MLLRTHTYLFVLLVSLFLSSSCKVNDPSDVSKKKQILDGLTGKSWKALRVQEGSVTVYQEGRSDNIYPGYRNYQLAFSSQNVSVTFTEYTGEVFIGDWTVTDTNSRTYLILRNLTPPPTSSGGTLEFEVNSFTDTQLVITATKPNLKTGNTINVYTMVPR
ncbi:hypothetical protein [Fibrella forsythiae]|uniref:Lipocalin-like domain-containing protein n=1 Tax=Fibrella forsythiae TaxID=2817061 RepID=A0ABS3JJX8_9BACT|nr:hypothetical protein [Fibrella forsythiae]MBO0950298.1 hypothetical protein [Fibrella forsythiae]